MFRLSYHPSVCLPGFYMYTESSSPQKKGDTARLIGPTQKATSGKCLQFYYHMFGANMGTLNVYLKRNGRLYSSIWTTSGNQGDRWRAAQVTLSSPTDYQVSGRRINSTQYHFRKCLSQTDFPW